MDAAAVSALGEFCCSVQKRPINSGAAGAARHSGTTHGEVAAALLSQGVFTKNFGCLTPGGPSPAKGLALAWREVKLLFDPGR